MLISVKKIEAFWVAFFIFFTSSKQFRYSYITIFTNGNKTPHRIQILLIEKKAVNICLRKKSMPSLFLPNDALIYGINLKAW